MSRARTKTFAEYADNAPIWITLSNGDYYPDILRPACDLYQPIINRFGELIRMSESSERLFMHIVEATDVALRVQLLRVFRKYVCPEISVEMTKRKQKADIVVRNYADRFRLIQDVQAGYDKRPIPDEALCAVLWEYRERGKSGYDLTETFFAMFREVLPEYSIEGPERAGQDVLLSNVLPNYPNANRPVDFIVRQGDFIKAVGLARYDSDRGGAQEDDRTGGYSNTAREILAYAKRTGRNIKIIFVNDGPGLLLGSMWRDYANLEVLGKGRIIVITLRMLRERLTSAWIEA